MGDLNPMALYDGRENMTDIHELKSQPTRQMKWLKTLTGTKIMIRTPGEETNNRVTIIEYIEPPNSSPPIFTRHEFVEVFCVLTGVLTFQFMDEPRFKLAAGQNVTCPSWKPHSFWNETANPVTALLICSPAGLDQFFVASNKLLQETAGDDSGSASVEQAMKTLRTRHGLEHVGAPPVL